MPMLANSLRNEILEKCDLSYYSRHAHEVAQRYEEVASPLASRAFFSDIAIIRLFRLYSRDAV
jgi:hypothetical protein